MHLFQQRATASGFSEPGDQPHCGICLLRSSTSIGVAKLEFGHTFYSKGQCIYSNTKLGHH